MPSCQKGPCHLQEPRKVTERIDCVPPFYAGSIPLLARLKASLAAARLTHPKRLFLENQIRVIPPGHPRTDRPTRADM